MSAQVVVIGGGFSMDPDTVLDDYVFAMTGHERPRVCFVPTATGDAPTYIERFHTALDLRCRTSVLRLFERDDSDPRSMLLDQDVIYVGGGNTANMLAVWRVHGVDRFLAEAYRSGVVLCGISAGMLCWFGCGVTDSFGPLRALNDGLGVLPGSACPHYDSEPGRRPTYHRAVAEGELPAGWALDDGAAALFVDGVPIECVARRPGAGLYSVTPIPGGVEETSFPVRPLYG
jgi:dipeptidase E